MTIQMQHLTIRPDARAWVRADLNDRNMHDALAIEGLFDVDLLAFVRHIMRERSDCRIVPVIVGAVVSDDANQWGHNMQVEVQYDNEGHRAIYAGKVERTGVTDVQCYMD